MANMGLTEAHLKDLACQCRCSGPSLTDVILALQRLRTVDSLGLPALAGWFRWDRPGKPGTKMLVHAPIMFLNALIKAELRSYLDQMMPLEEASKAKPE